VSVSIANILTSLNSIATYDGAWLGLKLHQPRLREQILELQQREERLEDTLLVGLVGGTGVGKSTLLNALAGDEIARTSEMRPCTHTPTVYHPSGMQLDFLQGKKVPRSVLEHLVLIDTPDTDSIVPEHRVVTEGILAQCDLVLLCATGEKYLNEATWSLLRPLSGSITLVCVNTKASPRAEVNAAIREDWLEELRNAGFSISEDQYFRVQALRSFDRKLAGEAPGEDELDFAALEHFLAHKLDEERIKRIKRSNATGLLKKMTDDLCRLAGLAETRLDEIEHTLVAAERNVAEACIKSLENRLLSENHVWKYSLGHEVGLRAKGLHGVLFRCIEFLRTLPMHISRFLPWNRWSGKLSQQTTTILTNDYMSVTDINAASEHILRVFNEEAHGIRLAFRQSDIEPADPDIESHQFRQRLNDRIAAVLQGPLRELLEKQSRKLTGRAVFYAFDIPIWLYLIWTAYWAVWGFVLGPQRSVAFFFHAGTTGLILALVLLCAFYFLLQRSADKARRECGIAFQLAIQEGGLAFNADRKIIDEIREKIQQIYAIRDQIRS